MRLPVQFHTSNKTADLLAFIDCRATENFISKKFVEQNQLGTRRLLIPKMLHNADGGENKGGKVMHYTDLKVATGKKIATLRFYLADMGEDQVILGYPWFVATNPKPNWAEGTLDATIILRTTGTARRHPSICVKVAGMRKAEIWNMPLLQKGEELYVRFA